MAKEYLLIGNGVKLRESEDGKGYDLKVEPAIRKESSTGKSDILANTMGGYASLGGNRKIMVTLIEVKPKKTGK
jgi:hypothetical protein